MFNTIFDTGINKFPVRQMKKTDNDTGRNRDKDAVDREQVERAEEI